MTPEARIKRYCAKIRRLKRAVDVAYLEVYPRSIVGGPNAYEKRTEWQEGWNAAALEVCKRISKSLSRAQKEGK